MVSPIDYTLNVRSPFEQSIRGFEFGQASRLRETQEERAQAQEARTAQEFPLLMEQRRQGIDIQREQEARAAELFRLQRAEEERARERQEMLRGRLTELAANPNATATDFATIMTEFPEVSSDLSRGWDMMSAPRQQNVLRDLSQVYSAIDTNNVPIAEQLLEERLTAAQNAGNEEDVRQTEIMLRTLRADPRAAKASIGLTIRALGGSAYDDLLTGGNVNVQSSQVIGGLASVAQMRDGSVRVTDVRTGEIVSGDAAQALLDEARQAEAESRRAREAGATEGRLTVQAELGATAAGATAAGTTGIEIGRQTFERLGPLRANIANLDRAIELVEDEGANTGVIASRLPNWNASTVELENLRNQLGLDVVGSVTFGALSESELELALQTALPTNLSEEALSDWLRRKRDAQDKLADYLTQQARFLSTPGRTLDQWIDFTESGSKDMRAWMRDNPIGRRTERAAPAEPAATGAAAPETTNADLQFMQDMQAKRERGERFTQEEIARIRQIAGRQ